MYDFRVQGCQLRLYSSNKFVYLIHLASDIKIEESCHSLNKMDYLQLLLLILDLTYVAVITGSCFFRFWGELTPTSFFFWLDHSVKVIIHIPWMTSTDSFAGLLVLNCCLWIDASVDIDNHSSGSFNEWPIHALWSCFTKHLPAWMSLLLLLWSWCSCLYF